jgi:AraC family transcriptional regulator
VTAVQEQADSLRRQSALDHLAPVEVHSLKLGLLGRVESACGVQILATHGMPNGRIENRLSADPTALIYTPRMPDDALISCEGQPFRPVAEVGLLPVGSSPVLRGSGAFRSAWCLFSPSFLTGLAEIEEERRISDMDPLRPIESGRLAGLGVAMLREAIAPGFGGPIFAEAMGIAIAVEVARLDGPRAFDDGRRRAELTPSQMRLLESYIRESPPDKLTLHDLARLVGTSIRYLSRSVKAARGTSVRRWIGEFRLAEARRLLVHTDLPINEIAGRCAFRSVRAFSAAFRAAIGCAPWEFKYLAS